MLNMTQRTFSFYFVLGRENACSNHGNFHARIMKLCIYHTVTHTHTHTHSHTHTHNYIIIYECKYDWLLLWYRRTRAHNYSHTNTHPQTPLALTDMHARTHKHTHKHAQRHAQTHAQTHTYTHTHTSACQHIISYGIQFPNASFDAIDQWQCGWI
jgi:hypothetical protein